MSGALPLILFLFVFSSFSNSYLIQHFDKHGNHAFEKMEIENINLNAQTILCVADSWKKIVRERVQISCDRFDFWLLHYSARTILHKFKFHVCRERGDKLGRKMQNIFIHF